MLQIRLIFLSFKSFLKQEEYKMFVGNWVLFETEFQDVGFTDWKVCTNTGLEIKWRSYRCSSMSSSRFLENRLCSRWPYYQGMFSVFLWQIIYINLVVNHVKFRYGIYIRVKDYVLFTAIPMVLRVYNSVINKLYRALMIWPSSYGILVSFKDL